MKTLQRCLARGVAVALALSMPGTHLGAGTPGQSSLDDSAGSLVRLLDVARSPSGAGVVAVLRRQASAKNLELGALLLEGSDDAGGRWVSLGSPGPCPVAAVGMTDEAAVVGCIRAGSLLVFSYRLEGGQQSTFAIPGVRQRPALGRGPDGGLYLSWLEDGASSMLWVQELDRQGERSGPPWSIGLGRGAARDLELLATARGDLHALWSTSASGHGDSSEEILRGCDLLAARAAGAGECSVAVTRPEEKVLSWWSSACSGAACWVLWFDGALRVRSLDLAAYTARDPVVVEARPGGAIRLPQLAATETGALAVWNESDASGDMGGWELRAQWIDSRADSAAVLASTDRPQDSSRVRVAGSKADVLVAWTSENGTVAHMFLR